MLSSGDTKAQWANFETKKLVPFNFRVQLSGSDLKNQVEENGTSDGNAEETDHDIQQLVAEEDKETKKYKAKSNGDSDSHHRNRPSKHHENGNGHDESGDSEDEEKRKAKIEYKVRSEGVKIGVSSDFWNNYKLDIGLAEELGEQALLTMSDLCSSCHLKHSGCCMLSAFACSLHLHLARLVSNAQQKNTQSMNEVKHARPLKLAPRQHRTERQQIGAVSCCAVQAAIVFVYL